MQGEGWLQILQNGPIIESGKVLKYISKVLFSYFSTDWSPLFLIELLFQEKK